MPQGQQIRGNLRDVRRVLRERRTGERSNRSFLKQTGGLEWEIRGPGRWKQAWRELERKKEIAG